MKPPLQNNVPAIALFAGRNPLAGRLLVLAAALLWSTSGLFAKAPHFQGWPGPVLAFWRALFACVLLAPLAAMHIARRPASGATPLWSWALVPATVFFGLMNYTYLTAMAEGTAANAIWLQSTAPVWVLLVGVLVFGEKSQWEDWLLVLLSAVGVGIILWFEARGQSLRSVLWGLAAGLFYGGVVLSLRHLRGMDSAWLVALNHVVTVGMLAPAALAGVAWKSDSAGYWPQGIQWGLLAAFGILQMGLPYMLFARGLRHIPGHEATGVGLLEPILMPLWVYLAWHLAPAWWTMAGAGFILLGLAVRYLAPGRTQSLSELPEPPEAPPIPLDGPSPSEASLK